MYSGESMFVQRVNPENRLQMLCKYLWLGSGKVLLSVHMVNSFNPLPFHKKQIFSKITKQTTKELANIALDLCKTINWKIPSMLNPEHVVWLEYVYSQLWWMWPLAIFCTYLFLKNRLIHCEIYAGTRDWNSLHGIPQCNLFFMRINYSPGIEIYGQWNWIPNTIHIGLFGRSLDMKPSVTTLLEGLLLVSSINTFFKLRASNSLKYF